MAVTLTKIKASADYQMASQLLGFKVAAATLTFDDSYPTGGETIGSTELAKVGMTTVDTVIGGVSKDGKVSVHFAGGNVVALDQANAATTAPAEVSNATDLTGTTVDILIIGS